MTFELFLVKASVKILVQILWNMFSSFFFGGGNFLRVRLLSQRVGVYENAKLPSKVTVAFYTPTSNVQEF